jgi:Rad3-related DNA helicase
MDYITPIKEQLNERMHEVCNIFMLIGTPLETPRYYNYAGRLGDDDDNIPRENTTIRIGSTQNRRLFFLVETPFDYFEIQTDEFWEQFKKYRTEFLTANYPTINPY